MDCTSAGHVSGNSSASTAMGMPLAAAPRGSRARLMSPCADADQAAALSAMGLTMDEVIVVHKSGEPTIVSLGSWSGRRIGLSARAARGLKVMLEG